MSKNYYSLGLMSGTSGDGVDASLISSDGDTTYNVEINKYFEYENNLIKVFFDKGSLDLIGWETKDIYQNLTQTFLSDININVNIEEKIFSLQKYIN